jgi:hypothetical protein
MHDGEAIPLVKGILMNSLSTPEGPGSVAGAPHLPGGFADHSPEEAPEETLTAFLAPYRDAQVAAHHRGPQAIPV